MFQKNSHGFTLVELLISIIIFTIGLMSVYSLITSSIHAAATGRDKIMASNIGQERIEIVRYIRDRNWVLHQNWNTIFDFSVDTPSQSLWTAGHYSIDNTDAGFQIKKLAALFDESREHITSDIYGLRLYSHTPTGRIVHSRDPASLSDYDPLPYFVYVTVDPLITQNNTTPVTVEDAYHITVTVASNIRAFRTYEFHTIITNWKQ